MAINRIHTFFIGLLIGAALLFFTHHYWCQYPKVERIEVPSHSEPAVIQGYSLSNKDINRLNDIRYPHDTATLKNPIDSPRVVLLDPVLPEGDHSFKIDTTIPWRIVDSSQKVIDTGFFHIRHISDCLFQRDIDLFVESTPRHNGNNNRTPISAGLLEAIGKADKWIRLAAFFEHDFFKGNYTLGVRAHIDLGSLHFYGAAALGAQNLPVGVEYDLWKP